MNVNVPLGLQAELEAGKVIARRVSERGGGLSGVQAMALVHEPSSGCDVQRIEIACNLLTPSLPGSTPEDVERRIGELAIAQGLGPIQQAYMTGKTESELRRLLTREQELCVRSN